MWEMPAGLRALYLDFGWDDGVVLCIYRDGSVPEWQRTHEVEASKVEAILYAMGQTDDKRVMFERMVRGGVIRRTT